MEKVKKFLKNYYKDIIVLLIVAVSIIGFSRMSGINKATQLIVAMLMIIFSGIIIIVSKEKKLKEEIVFAGLVFVLGLGFAISIPIGGIPDERNHFLRAYEITQGKIISNQESSGYFPKEIDEYFYNWQKLESYKYDEYMKNVFTPNSGELNEDSFPNTSLYSPICYIPQCIGIFIGRIFNLPILVTAYLARISNLICFAIIVFFAIKLIPFYKKELAFVGLLPITLQEAASLSADSLTIAISIFFISYIMNLVFSKEEKIKTKDFIILLSTLIIISLSKIVYVPLILLLALIPNERFKNKKDKWTKIGILVVITLVINFIWLGISSSHLSEIREGVNEKEQVKYVLTNPIQYCKTFCKTIFVNFDFYIDGIVGQMLESYDVNLAKGYTFVSLVLIAGLCVTENSIYKLNIKQKIIILITFLAIIALIFTALYVQWTPLYNPIIEGIQGRYFIPILMLLLILVCDLFNRNSSGIDKKTGNFYLWYYFVIVNVYAISKIISSHILK